jgi:hypothetical protein
MPDPAEANGAPEGAGGVERLLGHLDSYFLVAELVAGWRAGLLAAGPSRAAEIAGRAGAHVRSTEDGWPCCARAAVPATTTGSSGPRPAWSGPSTWCWRSTPSTTSPTRRRPSPGSGGPCGRVSPAGLTVYAASDPGRGLKGG